MIPFLIHIPVAFWLVYQMYQQEKSFPLRPFFWSGLGLKVLAGIGLGLLYLYYYPYKGDTFALFKESERVSRLAFAQPGAYFNILLLNEWPSEEFVTTLRFADQPRAFFMAKLLSIFNLFTFHNYWITGFYTSLFSFWSMWRLANRLVHWFPGTQLAAGVAFLLFPTVVIWSSGVLKETLAMGFLCSSLATVLSLKSSGTVVSIQAGKWVYILLSIWMVWQLKFYYLAVCVPVATGGILAWIIQQRYPAVRVSALLFTQLLWLVFALVVVGLGVSYLLERAVLESVVLNYEAFTQVSKPGKYIIFESLRATPSSFFRHFPVALWSGLFAPLPWQASNGLSWGVSIENTILLLLTGVYLVSVLRRHLSQKPPLPYAVVVQAVWLYVALLAVVLAFTAPNFGTLSRYKVGFLPFWVYVLLSRWFIGNTFYSDRRKTA